MKNKWWDEYQGEPVICLHEFGRKHEMLSEHLKEWADHYPIRVETKFGGTVLRPKAVVITSNYHPESIWQEEEVLEPMLRRFSVFQFPQDKDSEDFQRVFSKIKELDGMH